MFRLASCLILAGGSESGESLMGSSGNAVCDRDLDIMRTLLVECRAGPRSTGGPGCRRWRCSIWRSCKAGGRRRTRGRTPCDVSGGRESPPNRGSGGCAPVCRNPVGSGEQRSEPDSRGTGCGKVGSVPPARARWGTGNGNLQMATAWRMSGERSTPSQKLLVPRMMERGFWRKLRTISAAVPSMF